MFLSELRHRLRFWRGEDRVGPDIPLTHWRLYFPITMRKLCEEKFGRFATGAEFRPGSYAISCSKISIGERVVIRPGSMLFADPREGDGTISLEDDVIIGSGLHVYVHDHAFSDPSVPIIDQGHSPSKPVVVERGAWLGARVTILSGVTIGKNSVIGAGSVVTKSIPPHTVAVGNPARVVRTLKTNSESGVE